MLLIAPDGLITLTPADISKSVSCVFVCVCVCVCVLCVFCVVCAVCIFVFAVCVVHFVYTDRYGTQESHIKHIVCSRIQHRTHG